MSRFGRVPNQDKTLQPWLESNPETPWPLNLIRILQGISYIISASADMTLLIRVTGQFIKILPFHIRSKSRNSLYINYILQLIITSLSVAVMLGAYQILGLGGKYFGFPLGRNIAHHFFEGWCPFKHPTF